MSEMQRDGSEMRCKRCGANECRIHGFCSVECEHYFDYEEEITDLNARIAELEEAQRWIPVSERLPDTKIVYDKFDVIVEFEDIENGVMTRCVELMSYDYRNKSWNDDCWEFGFYPVAGVTHWRERPTPPEVQE